MPTKVKFVQYGEQAKVKVVQYGEDMRVIPVEYGEEMKVKAVEYGENFKVKIVQDTSPCFITSACIQAKGLPDDCYELNTIRGFRDSYIKAMPDGERILHEYYAVAPQIVAAINKTEDPRQVYSNVYEQLTSIVELIHSGENGEVLRNYFRILNELKQRYL